MISLAQITIHSSQFPATVRRDLLHSLRSRQVNHKFHYDTVKQTHKWLALHEAYSPSRVDPECMAIYDQSFQEAAPRMQANRVHLFGLGCGGGQKDVRLLKLLRDAGKEVFYTPSDVSTAMVLVARQAALEVIPEERCFPLVGDLATAEDLPLVFKSLSVLNATRLVTFFGMLPNFEPHLILPRLGSLLNSDDCLLLSANLAPGQDYAAGVRRILPLYDNPLTRDWLLAFLLDLGIERSDGEIRFIIEDDSIIGGGLKKIAARFDFVRNCAIEVDSERFEFCPEDSIRLFFSYRHTPALVRSLLLSHGMQVRSEWIAPSNEEGVFLAIRQ